MACRGELERPLEILKKLKCKYISHHTPFSKLARLKLEEISLDPFVVVYHNVMYDSEIQILQNMAKPVVNIQNCFLNFHQKIILNYI